jgi:myo-inositol 2-dehydrogenase/D-chiro-inositol 1-dehydrogenase
MERYTEAYLEEMRAFLKAISEDSEPEVTGWDGRIPVVMAYAAKLSITKQRPVRLEEITECSFDPLL